MKKILSFLLVSVSSVIIGTNIVLGNEEESNLVKVSYETSINENVKLDELRKEAILDGKKAASMINDIKQNDEFEYAVRQILDMYYYDDVKVNTNLEGFIKTIDERAEYLVANYQEAFEERKSAIENGYAPNQILVSFKSELSDEEINQIINKLSEGGDILTNKYAICSDMDKEKKDLIKKQQSQKNKKIVEITIGEGETTQKAIDKYKSLDCVIDASVNYVYDCDELTTDSVDINDTYAYGMWHLERINIEPAWESVNTSTTARRVRVAVIDSGVQMNHEDLSGRIINSLSVDVTSEPYALLSSLSTPYVSSHGTNVTGLLAANVNNSIGIAGVAGVTNSYNDYNCRIMAIQVYTLYPDGEYKVSTSNLLKAIDYAICNDAEVINLSMSTYSYNADVADAISDAYDAGVTVVASAGNDNSTTPAYPASYPHVISVIASDTDNGRAYFSNYGSTCDISAPGFSIQTTDVGSSYVCSNGTSLSAPMVSGTVMMMRAINDDLTVDEIENIIETTATDVGSTGYDYNTGYGILDAGLAVQKAKYLTFSNTAPVVSLITPVSSGKIKLNWSLVGNEERYNVYRSTSLNGTYTNIKSISVNGSGPVSYTDTGLVSGQRYYYKIWCKSKYGDTYMHGPFSTIVSCVAN